MGERTRKGLLITSAWPHLWGHFFKFKIMKQEQNLVAHILHNLNTPVTSEIVQEISGLTDNQLSSLFDELEIVPETFDGEVCYQIHLENTDPQLDRQASELIVNYFEKANA